MQLRGLYLIFFFISDHKWWLIVKVIVKYYYRQYGSAHFMTNNWITPNITMSSHNLWWVVQHTDVYNYISHRLSFSLLNIIKRIQVHQCLQHVSSLRVGTTLIQTSLYTNTSTTFVSLFNCIRHWIPLHQRHLQHPLLQNPAPLHTLAMLSILVP